MVEIELVDVGEGRMAQKCPKCPYVSPVVTNRKMDVLSAGLRMHLKKTHKLSGA